MSKKIYYRYNVFRDIIISGLLCGLFEGYIDGREAHGTCS